MWKFTDNTRYIHVARKTSDDVTYLYLPNITRGFPEGGIHIFSANEHACASSQTERDDRMNGQTKGKENACARTGVRVLRAVSPRATGDHGVGIKGKVCRAASGDVCASLTVTSFNANADAFVQQSHARLLSRRMTSMSASRVGALNYRGSCVFRDTSSFFSLSSHGRI